MPIQLTCSCGRNLQAQEEHAGRRVKCPACGEEMTVPKADDDGVQPKPRQAAVLDDEDAGDRPRRRSRREEEDDDDDRPRRRSRREDDDEDDEDRPRRRRSRRDDEDDDDDGPRRESEGTSGKAVATLVLGVLTFCTGLAALPAIILGIMSLVEIGRSRGRLGGKGLAIAGLITTVIGGVFFVVALAFSVLSVREAAARVKVSNDMRQLGLAMQNYSVAHGGQLPEAIPDPKRVPAGTKLSWRVQLLPLLGYDNLYRQFHHNEPWDSPHNKTLLTQMPKVFAHPRQPEAEAQGLTYYRVFTGPQTPFPPGGPLRFPAGFTDGTSNTILIAEAADPVPWTKPDELEYDPQRPLPRLGGHFRSGFVVGMADGQPHLVGPGVSERTLRSAITANGGEVLGPDW